MAYVFTKDVLYYPSNSAGGTGFCLVVWSWKELLKTAGWTVVGSGTGTGGTFGASDLITTAAILNASIGDRAYFILQRPGDTFQLCCQRVGSDYQWRVKMSPTGFAAPASANATPAAADEVFIEGGGTDASPSGTQMSNNGGNWRAQMAADNAAPYTFYFFGHTQGATTPNVCLYMDFMKAGSYPAEDLQPWVIGSSTNGACFTTSTMQQTYFQPLQYGSACAYFSATLSAANLKYVQAESGWQSIPGNLGTNPFNGKDDAIDITWARYAAAGAPYGVKGVGTMIKWMGITRSMGSTLSISTSMDRYCIGNCSLPWDGSVPNI